LLNLTPELFPFAFEDIVVHSSLLTAIAVCLV